MTQYCKLGDKPKVIYRKNGASEDNVFYANVSPIDVTVVPYENPNLPNQMYAWNFSTALNPRTTLEQMPFRAIGKLTDFKVTGLINTDTVNGVQIGNWSCQFKDGNGSLIAGSAVGYHPNDPPTLAKILIPNPDSPSDICKLQIKDTNGNLLFTASGKCPILYKVACGDCPDESHKCTHNKYPGYCCVPCKQTGDRLKNLANKVGR
ncbi:hypothetical protein [Nostoc favosum]|uniref:Uncharacterized protein n=1 Tax=Nostoc favosum CHAB5714 TaxID=2780399 RepID=A0ABS8I152_9NOSO|nr:hypothetical protein [Nostoc favosum]MCC5597969.1 hypothetical protein [Nostoc favosum CHAB5714]